MTTQATRKIPRASFSITLLDDEDFRILMSDKCGTSGLGVFLALCLVGRRRLLDRRARRIDGTDALVIENSIDHTLDLARVRRKEFDAFLDLMQRIATQTGSQPWVYVDGDGRIVIRSFFKFNADANHGGPRDGAGRESRRNQDDSSGNQDHSSATKGGASVSSSVSFSSSVSVLNSRTQAAPLPEDPDPAPPPTPLPRPPADGSVGCNSAADVARVLDLAEEIDPLGKTRTWCRQWLFDHPAWFVIQCMQAAAGKDDPCTYAGRLVRKGPEAMRASRPKPPPEPRLKPWKMPEVTPDTFALTPAEEAALARREKTA